ncbi:hypothetical protein HanPSC8_Chr11g0454731 [Helianthus annuus]|nr:hypothetical protein HanPSC8_Chr11g0454731 [Helianthus annuus]
MILLSVLSLSNIVLIFIVVSVFERGATVVRMKLLKLDRELVKKVLPGLEPKSDQVRVKTRLKIIPSWRIWGSDGD